MARSTSGDSLLTRVMRVLEAFGPEKSSLTISEIAERANLPTGTAHRLVTEMVSFRLLERDPVRGFRIGTRMWEMSLRSAPLLGLREAALPAMENLHGVVGQHVQLAVLAEGEVLYLERLSRRGAVVNVATIASRLPTYSCSSGLVLLAHGPAELREKVLAGPFARYTPQSITDAARLRRSLAHVRRHGYGVAPGLIVASSKGVAAPIRGSDGTVVAALSIVIPLVQDHRPLIPVLFATARSISALMGADVRTDDFVREFNPSSAS
ncbi:IclR family transcriptional regulator [Georgenia ruanii]|uniref:IclR family transcriptional regulator n=1 Tax=Georgenia ruanii TaxID=348442 RepID=UPI0031E455A1